MKKRIILLTVFLLIHIFPTSPSIINTYKNNKIIHYLSLLNRSIIPEFILNSPLYSQVAGNPYENYIRLKKLYLKWNYGLFKSTRYYRKYIKNYCISIIGKEIQTDNNYFLISPEGIFNKELTCNLYAERWLRIKGDIKQEDLLSIVEKNPTLLTKWWRSAKLISVSGRVKDFKLDYDIYGEALILYLKDIKIKESKQK